MASDKSNSSIQDRDIPNVLVLRSVELLVVITIIAHSDSAAPSGGAIVARSSAAHAMQQ